jgi:SprA-related family.
MQISSAYPSVAHSALQGGAGVRAASAPATSSIVPAVGDRAAQRSNLPPRPSSLAPVEQSSSSERNRLRGDEDAAERRRLAQQEQLIQNQIKSLAARDREVRAHEQAHVAAGGQYAGAASYQYERGPNGVNYAVSGEVRISTSEEPTPEATLRKAQIIRRAALAPAEPSPQDRRVAAMAAQMETAARAEIARARDTETEDSESGATQPTAPEGAVDTSTTAPADKSAQPVSLASERESLLQRLSSLDGTARRVGTLLSQHA